jgi:hypothetical protein
VIKTGSCDAAFCDVDECCVANAACADTDCVVTEGFARNEYDGVCAVVVCERNTSECCTIVETPTPTPTPTPSLPTGNAACVDADAPCIYYLSSPACDTTADGNLGTCAQNCFCSVCWYFYVGANALILGAFANIMLIFSLFSSFYVDAVAPCIHYLSSLVCDTTADGHFRLSAVFAFLCLFFVVFVNVLSFDFV